MKAVIKTGNEQSVQDISETEIPNLKVLYKGIFISPETREVLMDRYPIIHENVFYDHMTIEFSPKEFDESLGKGELTVLNVIGHLTTDKVDVLIVEPNDKRLNSKNKHGHITLSTAEGVRPYESNTEIEDHLGDIVWKEHFPIMGEALNCCVLINYTHFLKK